MKFIDTEVVRSVRPLVICFLLLTSLCVGLRGQALVRTVGVNGTTLAGTSFTMEIDASPSYVRTIDFVGLETDYSPAAMAELMLLKINEDYRDNGKTGFVASNVNSRPESKEFDSTYVITCTAPIVGISVGMLGNPSVPIPRAPGVAFNPNIITFDANNPIPFQGPQPDQANATFSMNGEIPTFDLFRRVKVLTQTTVNFNVSSLPNVNQPLLMMGGIFNPGAYQAPWGDFLDIGTYAGGAIPPDIQVIGDGITPQTIFDAFFRTNSAGDFDINIFVTSNFAGVQGFAYQCLVLDPTNMPLALRLTNAVTPSFDTGQRFSFTPPSNGSVEVPFTPGFTFDFYGSTYSSAFVHEDGFLTFGAQGLLGNAIDPNAALNGQPAIFVNWADWDLAGSQIDVFQFGDEMRFSWGNQNLPITHNGEGDAAYFTSVLRLTRPTFTSLDAGGILLDHVQLDRVSLTNNDAIVGITPGFGLDTNPVSRDLGGLRFGNGIQSSLLLQHNSAGGFASQLGVASGAPQIYHNGSGVAGRDLAFFPPNSAGIQANKPFAIPSNPNPDDVQGIVGPNTLSASGGAGQALLFSGYFRYLFSGPTMAQVILDPIGAAGFGPVPLQIQSIMDPQAIGFPVTSVPLQPGFRSFEGLNVVVSTALPPVGGSTLVDVLFIFGDGGTFLLPGAVNIMP